MVEIEKPSRPHRWQPGYLEKTRGFPSSDHSEFGFVMHCMTPLVRHPTRKINQEKTEFYRNIS